mgnify:CR=1 FL=1
MTRPARVRMDADERERSLLEIARAVRRLGSYDVVNTVRAALILADRNDLAKRLDTP